MLPAGAVLRSGADLLHPGPHLLQTGADLLPARSDLLRRFRRNAPQEGPPGSQGRKTAGAEKSLSNRATRNARFARAGRFLFCADVRIRCHVRWAKRDPVIRMQIRDEKGNVVLQQRVGLSAQQRK